jgi:hypothetical protein
MEKILNIDGRDVKFKSTASFLLRYKMQFQRDGLKDLLRLQGAIDLKTKKVADIESLDLEVFYNMTWTLAKVANPEIPPPLEWLDTFSEFPLIEIIPEIIELMMLCLQSSVQSKKKI